MTRDLTNPGWGDGLHIAVANFIADQGNAWRLHWVDRPGPDDDADEFTAHYAWQHREHDADDAGNTTATLRWVTKTRHATLREFADFHGVAVPA